MPQSPAGLLKALDALTGQVATEADRQVAVWVPMIQRAAFRPSAANLACYLAFRRRDLRRLQRPLMALGLSSLGRLEGRVIPTLKAVRRALGALASPPTGTEPTAHSGADPDFLAGEVRLAANAEAIFGAPTAPGAVALMVTCPSEAAKHPAFMAMMVEKRVQAVRINCAHDTPRAWKHMIRHLRDAEAASGRRVRIFMDLAGPKIRTGTVHCHKGHKRARVGDIIAMCAPGTLHAAREGAHVHIAVECTLPQALYDARPGDRLLVDDGLLEAEVTRGEAWGIVARVLAAPKKGLQIRPEKGVNFPGGRSDIAALTDKDRRDLKFVSAHADAIEYSLVQSAADVVLLQDALAALRPDDWRSQALVLKIETARAVRNLPEIIVQAAAHQPTAIMIARGDLAVEIGFSRTAEIQEEILWLGEAADVPVIWATQVLDGLIRTGEASRGEMTDAAMAARAECVMLNKGPFLAEGIDQLRILLARMTDHQHKKTPQLRALKSWGSPVAQKP